jgi:hypothetical protein
MPETTEKADWLAEHEWLIHELLHETRKLARCRGKVDGATQRGFDMALQAVLAHAQNVDPRHLVVAGRGNATTIPYALYMASRVEVHALRKAAESLPKIPKLTRSDTKALWHAVQGQGEVISLRLREGFTLDEMAPARAHLFEARAALRKVNAIRKAQADRKPAGSAHP